MGYRRRPLSAAVARFSMRIIDFIIYGIAISYGIAIAAAYTVGLHSGSTSNNHIIDEHNLNNFLEDARDEFDRALVARPRR